MIRSLEKCPRQWQHECLMFFWMAYGPTICQAHNYATRGHAPGWNMHEREDGYCSLDDDICFFLLQTGGRPEATYLPGSGRDMMITVLSTGNLAFPLLLVGGLFLLSRRSQGGMGGPGGNNPLNFGKSKAKFQMEPNTGITFDDVAGVDEAKQDFMEVRSWCLQLSGVLLTFRPVISHMFMPQVDQCLVVSDISIARLICAQQAHPVFYPPG
jgi:hypothetical protein